MEVVPVSTAALAASMAAGFTAADFAAVASEGQDWASD
jgi:hypothetical protein